MGAKVMGVDMSACMQNRAHVWGQYTLSSMQLGF